MSVSTRSGLSLDCSLDTSLPASESCHSDRTDVVGTDIDGQRWYVATLELYSSMSNFYLHWPNGWYHRFKWSSMSLLLAITNKWLQMPKRRVLYSSKSTNYDMHAYYNNLCPQPIAAVYLIILLLLFYSHPSMSFCSMSMANQPHRSKVTWLGHIGLLQAW